MDVEVYEALIGLVVAALVLGEILILRVVIPWVKARTTREQRELAYGIVQSAVGMAEKKGLLERWDGRKKKRQAEGWIHRRFQKLGIEYDDEEISGWIEDVLSDLDLEVWSSFVQGQVFEELETNDELERLRELVNERQGETD